MGEILNFTETVTDDKDGGKQPAGDLVAWEPQSDLSGRLYLTSRALYSSDG